MNESNFHSCVDNEVRERPILFSGALVRAILEGRKTVTRRLVKAQESTADGLRQVRASSNNKNAGKWRYVRSNGVFLENIGNLFSSPYGHAGDQLWVRETFAEMWSGECGCPAEYPAEYGDRCDRCERYDLDTGFCDVHHRIEFRADGESDTAAPGSWPEDHPDRPRWKPSIHMPRWASRIDLRILSVRPERLQSMNGHEARLEGLDLAPCLALSEFRELWDQINGKRVGASWNENPWVWRIEFERIRP